MTDSDETKLLRRIEHMLDQGLVTEVEPIPDSSQATEAILNRLRELPPGDVRGRLVIGGFTQKPYAPDIACMSCMYFLRNRRWCDLPELALPVRPGWWCRLWRV